MPVRSRLKSAYGKNIAPPEASFIPLEDKRRSGRYHMVYEYDAVVVGAGNGGLAAASRLSAAGLRTVLLEKHNLPGGVATSFVRGRFEFEASLHELCDVGTPEEPGSIRKMFSSFGSDEVMLNEKNLFRAIVTGENGYDVTLSAGRKEFRESLLRISPGSGKSLDLLDRILARNRRALEYNEKKGGKPNRLLMLLRYRMFLISASHTLEELLKSMKFPAEARRVLETYWLYLGVPADEINAFHYFQMLSGYIDGGAGVPRLKSYGLSLSLADVITKNGGDIRYNTEVTEVIYGSDGKVAGVKAGGDEYRARKVISNVIPHNVMEMSGNGNASERDRKLLNAKEFGLSFVCIYLGLDMSAGELGIKDYSVFISHGEKASSEDDSLGTYVVNCLNIANPGASPEGTCTLFITVPVYDDSFMKDVTPENYRKFKSDTAEKYISDCESVCGISIKDHIEEISVATPETFARYFSAPNGTAYGYRLSKKDGIMSRILEGDKEFDFGGVIFCGGHSETGIGFGVSYTSGVSAAEKALAMLGKEEDGIEKKD